MEGKWRKDFPVLETQVHGHGLVYLDNAATSQMPRQVIERLSTYYASEHANVHRGIHYLSERATDAVETARRRVADFIGAASPDEVVFTSGATESLNMVAFGIADTLPAGSAVVVSDLEHHSNYVPWQQACTGRDLEFCVCPSRDGELCLEVLEDLLRTRKVGVLAITQVSNLVGTVMPLSQLVALAHRFGALVVVDGAQGILHEGIDVAAADVDFYAFSGHKMCAPTGVGVLFGKREFLERLRPLRFGGGMVDQVGERETTWGAMPLRLEAGTPNIAGIVGLDAAIAYLEENDLAAMRSHERALLDYATARLLALEGLEILGQPQRRCGLVSFNLAGAHAFDVAFMLDKMGVAVRSGHHCAQPACKSLGVDSCVRASLAFYNQHRDIDCLCEGLERVHRLLH